MKLIYITLMAATLALGACRQNTGGEQNTANTSNNTETGMPTDTAQQRQQQALEQQFPPGYENNIPEIKLANIVSIEKIDNPGNSDPNNIFIMTVGKLPNPCTLLGEVKQQQTGNTIDISVFTQKPPNAHCPPAEMPLRHSIMVDISKIEKGNYTVVVNGIKASFVKK